MATKKSAEESTSKKSAARQKVALAHISLPVKRLAAAREL